MSLRRGRLGSQFRQRAVARACLEGHPSEALAKQWMLRLLVDLQGWKVLFAGTPMDEAMVLASLEVEVDLDDSWSPSQMRQALRAPLEQRHAEAWSSEAHWDGALGTNLGRLATLLGLSETEQALLGFAVVLHTYPPLVACTEAWRELSAERALQLLARVLEAPLPEVRGALAPTSLLSRSGLLVLKREGTERLSDKLALLPGLAERLLEPHLDPVQMLASFFREAPPATLGPKDFAYLREWLERVRRLVRRAVAQRVAGVNVLIYGPPGTGKTELARVIAASLTLRLYEVVSEKEGEVLSGPQRFGAYRLSQRVLAHQNRSLVLFDEVEDVFGWEGDGAFLGAGSVPRPKAWVNDQLESNPLPTLWISNGIKQIDRAFLRRFDLILKLEPPPRAVRCQILRQHLAGLGVTETWIERIAAHPQVVPGLVARAARAATLVGSRGAAATERHLEAVLAGTLEAMGQDPRLEDSSEGPLGYRLEALNPDRDLVQLGKGLRRHPCGRFCLYGPPGTGKSAWGRHLADSLDRPLLAKRASDLLGPYVGQTEKAIARMFRQAEQDQAVLLLDEADSFLRDRRGAHQSWEVSQVNELLTQMERFEGLFLCSTNLMDQLDEASLRRFDLKIRFDWLKPEQAWVLFCQVLKEQRVRLPGAGTPWRERLAGLDRLAPGDFALVVRQNRLTGEPLSPERLYTELAREVELKRGGGKGMGFMAHL